MCKENRILLSEISQIVLIYSLLISYFFFICIYLDMIHFFALCLVVRVYINTCVCALVSAGTSKVIKLGCPRADLLLTLVIKGIAPKPEETI